MVFLCVNFTNIDWFAGDNHHDCHEFLNWLLNDLNDSLVDEMKKKGAIKEELKSPIKRPNNKRTWVEEIFQGVMSTSITCKVCETKTISNEPFLELPIDLKSNVSLKSSILDMEHAEMMDGDNQFFCDNCKKKTDAEKKVEMKSLPNSLIVQLKRFKYDERLGYMTKVNYMIPFPVDLK